MRATWKVLFYAFCLVLSVVTWRRASGEREERVGVPNPAEFEELGFTYRDDGTRIGRYLCQARTHRCLQTDEDGTFRALFVAQPQAPVGVFRRYELRADGLHYAGFTVRHRLPETGTPRHFQDFDIDGNAVGPVYHFLQTGWYGGVRNPDLVTN